MGKLILYRHYRRQSTLWLHRKPPYRCADDSRRLLRDIHWYRLGCDSLGRSFGFGRSPCYWLGLRTDLSGHYACHPAIVRRRKRTNIYWASARQRIRRIFDSPAAVWSAVQSYLTVFVCAVYRFDSAAHACHVPAHDEKVPCFRRINLSSLHAVSNTLPLPQQLDAVVLHTLLSPQKLPPMCQ